MSVPVTHFDYVLTLDINTLFAPKPSSEIIRCDAGSGVDIARPSTSSHWIRQVRHAHPMEHREKNRMKQIFVFWENVTITIVFAGVIPVAQKSCPRIRPNITGFVGSNSTVMRACSVVR